MAPSDTTDIVGLREQIIGKPLRSVFILRGAQLTTSPCRSRVPMSLQGTNSVTDIKFKIIIHGGVYADVGGDFCAEVRWGGLKKPFLQGDSGATPTHALRNLLELSASVLRDLIDDDKLEDIATIGNSDGWDGVVVHRPSELGSRRHLLSLRSD